MRTSIEIAAAALRTRWGGAITIGDVADLGGSGRSTVTRVKLTGSHAPAPTAVIKIYPEGSTTWQDEAAAAAYLGRVGGGLTPDLLAMDSDHRTLVITDLGDHPQLSDALLADDPEIAEHAVLDWADSLGDLLARTFGGQEDYLRIRAELGLPVRSEFWADRMLRDACTGVVDKAMALGLPAPPGLHSELEDALELLADRDYGVIGPSDLCPDNNLVTADGVRFIDLEFGGCSSVFLEAAYVRVPFPTCWCSFDPPSGLLEMAEAAIRRRLVSARPGLVDDHVWRRGMARACALWTVMRAHWILAEVPDLRLDPWDNDGVLVPASNTVAVHMLSRVEATIGAELPHCTEFLSALHRRIIAQWPVPHLPPYPAFRSVP